MKRVTVREQEYFYSDISSTPFTLGIVMPTKYGKYRVSGGLELNQNRHIDANKIFPDDRWKLHPDWVYCEYNYAGTDIRFEFDSPEKNVKHFLERLADCQGLADCPKCDKELVQALGIELSFVATRSGLTRWEENKEKDEFDDRFDPDNPREPHFSEVNNKATDEVWYKRAVEYHYNNPNSFVFSVPFDIGDKLPTTVTATHAIFKEQNG